MGTATTAYLLAYNTTLSIGWFVILVKTVLAIYRHDPVYPTIEMELKIFQTAAVLEIAHSFFGLVRSPVATTAMQVFSRVVILWPVMNSVVEAQQGYSVIMLSLAWSITEVIRYSFYSFSLLNSVPHILLWCRYSLFIILYPIGITGELLTVVHALPGVKERKHYTIELPNPANISFSYYWALCVFMLFYIPVFPKLYCYMINQRRKYLGTELKKKKE